MCRTNLDEGLACRTGQGDARFLIRLPLCEEEPTTGLENESPASEVSVQTHFVSVTPLLA